MADYASAEIPKFIDMLAVDVVVVEHTYMRLTPAEKRHAAHGLAKQKLDARQIAAILHVSIRTVERLLDKPPPAILDVDQDGNWRDEAGNVVDSRRRVGVAS